MSLRFDIDLQLFTRNGGCTPLVSAHDNPWISALLVYGPVARLIVCGREKVRKQHGGRFIGYDFSFSARCFVSDEIWPVFARL